MRYLHLLLSTTCSLVRDNGGMQFSFSDDKIEELRKLVAEEFGKPVTLEEARVIADNLLEIYDLLRNIGQSSYS